MGEDKQWTAGLMVREKRFETPQAAQGLNVILFFSFLCERSG